VTASLERTAVRLLLVEDDEVDRLACRRALSRQADFPIELLEASSGREGLELVHQRHPDLVLLDYHLPDVNGLEFLEALRHDSGEMPVPVMMLTGADSVGVAVEAMRSGARDYLVKDRQRSYLELVPAVIARVMGEQRLRLDKRAAEEKFRTLVEQIPAITYIAVPDVGGGCAMSVRRCSAWGTAPSSGWPSPRGAWPMCIRRTAPAPRPPMHVPATAARHCVASIAC
jgi:CheY-like chemotaxis protein